MSKTPLRYQITERLDDVNPSENDPLAQAMPRHTGMYDLRDSLNKVICASGRNVRMLRKMQARWNTNYYLYD